jgi:hypothetical protein
MTNLTPEIIETATDEQLSEWVASYCLMITNNKPKRLSG